MRVGIWLPPRVNMQEATIKTPGILVEPLREGIVRRLSESEKIELIEGLDIRKAVIKNGKSYVRETCLNELDVFFWIAMIDKRADGHTLQVLENIKADTTVVNDVDGFTIALDKFKTSSFLHRNGIKVPRYVLLSKENIEAATDFIKEVGEVLLKPRYGDFGVGIVKLSDPDVLMDVLDYSNQPDYYLEEFLPNEFKGWCGVNVIGGEVVYGYAKKPELVKDWKVFDRDRIGGKMILKEPSQEQKEIALKVAELLNMELVGVDIIESNGDPYVIDVNTFPGLYIDMFEKAGIDGAEKIANCILKKVD